MQVRLLYQGHIVTEVSTSSPDGCFILQGSVPLGNERIYGPCSAQQLSFPSPEVMFQDPGITEAMGCLLSHLERGVLLWVAPDGVFVKRFCQGRVYWSGPLAEHTDRPNKLNRERTCKLLDVPIFHKGMVHFVSGLIRFALNKAVTTSKLWGGGVLRKLRYFLLCWSSFCYKWYNRRVFIGLFRSFCYKLYNQTSLSFFHQKSIFTHGT